MVQIINEATGLNMTAKFDLNQEVIVTTFQGYRKGVVVGISVNTNNKGTVFLYAVEFFVGKKGTSKIKKCLEKHLYSTVKEALTALSKQEESQDDVEDNVKEK